jgi:hypothetical protein
VANRICGRLSVESVGSAISSGAVLRGTIDGAGGVVHGLLGQGDGVVQLGLDGGFRLAQVGRQLGVVAVLNVQLRARTEDEA